MFSLYFRGLPRREAYSQLSGTHRFEDSEEDFWVNWLSQSLVDVRLANRRCSPLEGCSSQPRMWLVPCPAPRRFAEAISGRRMYEHRDCMQHAADNAPMEGLHWRSFLLWPSLKEKIERAGQSKEILGVVIDPYIASRHPPCSR